MPFERGRLVREQPGTDPLGAVPGLFEVGSGLGVPAERERDPAELEVDRPPGAGGDPVDGPQPGVGRQAGRRHARAAAASSRATATRPNMMSVVSCSPSSPRRTKPLSACSFKSSRARSRFAAVQLHHRQAGGVARPLGGIDVEELVEGARIGRAAPRQRRCRAARSRRASAALWLPVASAAAATVAAWRSARVEVSRQQRPHALEQRHVPADQGLAELLGEAGERGDAAVDGGQVADLEVGHDPEAVARPARGHGRRTATASSTIVSALSRRVIVCAGPAKASFTAASACAISAGSPTCCASSRASVARCRAVAIVSGVAAADRQAGQQHRPQLGGVVGEELEGVGDERGLLVARDRDLPRHRSGADAEDRSGHGLRMRRCPAPAPRPA